MSETEEKCICEKNAGGYYINNHCPLHGKAGTNGMTARELAKVLLANPDMKVKYFDGNRFLGIQGIKESHRDPKYFLLILSKEPNFSPIRHGDDLYTVKLFKKIVDSHAFVDDDGSAYWATSNQRSDIQIRLSDINKIDVPDWATHVSWFNK